MFNKARLKLTFWYLLIIMLISISFSVFIYRFLTSEFNRVLRMEKLRQQGLWTPPKTGMIHIFLENNEIIQKRPIFISPPNPEVLEEAKARLLYILISINLAILGLSGAAGYFLAGRTLRPIKNMIDEQNRFITDASHELRTPLTSLKSEIEVNLRDKKLTLAEAKKLLESNLEEVNNLQYLSDNLMKLGFFVSQTKLAQTHKANGVKFEKVSLLQVSEEAVKKVGKLAKKKNIHIINKTEGQSLQADRQSLIELFVILLDNAIKYSPPDTTVTISSATSRLHPKGVNSVLINVSDEGIGIDKKDLPFLFDRFYRSDKSRSEEGFGLGLSIAKQIVDKHNGSIEVKSELNKGTTFTIKLP